MNIRQVSNSIDYDIQNSIDYVENIFNIRFDFQLVSEDNEDVGEYSTWRISAESTGPGPVVFRENEVTFDPEYDNDESLTRCISSLIGDIEGELFELAERELAPARAVNNPDIHPDSMLPVNELTPGQREMQFEIERRMRDEAPRYDIENLAELWNIQLPATRSRIQLNNHVVILFVPSSIYVSPGPHRNFWEIVGYLREHQGRESRPVVTRTIQDDIWNSTSDNRDQIASGAVAQIISDLNRIRNTFPVEERTYTIADLLEAGYELPLTAGAIQRVRTIHYRFQWESGHLVLRAEDFATNSRFTFSQVIEDAVWMGRTETNRDELIAAMVIRATTEINRQVDQSREHLVQTVQIDYPSPIFEPGDIVDIPGRDPMVVTANNEGILTVSEEITDMDNLDEIENRLLEEMRSGNTAVAEAERPTVRRPRTRRAAAEPRQRPWYELIENPEIRNMVMSGRRELQTGRSRLRSAEAEFRQHWNQTKPAKDQILFWGWDVHWFRSNNLEYWRKKIVFYDRRNRCWVKFSPGGRVERVDNTHAELLQFINRDRPMPEWQYRKCLQEIWNLFRRDFSTLTNAQSQYVADRQLPGQAYSLAPMYRHVSMDRMRTQARTRASRAELNRTVEKFREYGFAVSVVDDSRRYEFTKGYNGFQFMNDYFVPIPCSITIIYKPNENAISGRARSEYLHTWHPHISDGNICLGEPDGFPASFKECIAAGDPEFFNDQIVNLLNCYNPESPYTRLRELRWPLIQNRRTNTFVSHIEVADDIEDPE